MKCPKCQVDLMISDRQSIEIDFCRSVSLPMSSAHEPLHLTSQ